MHARTRHVGRPAIGGLKLRITDSNHVRRLSDGKSPRRT